MTSNGRYTIKPNQRPQAANSTYSCFCSSTFKISSESSMVNFSNLTGNVNNSVTSLQLFKKNEIISTSIGDPVEIELTIRSLMNRTKRAAKTGHTVKIKSNLEQKLISIFKVS